MTAALLWGALAGSSLLVGALLGVARTWPRRLVGLVLAFGAGALIASVAFELAEEGVRTGGPVPVAVGIALGALAFTGGNHAIQAMGARRHRGHPDREVDDADGSGAGLALGAFLDGIPEQAVLGIGLEQPVERQQAGEQCRDPQHARRHPGEPPRFRPDAEGHEQQHDQEEGDAEPGPAAGAQRELNQALRRELERQRQGLPNVGGQAGEDARDALDRAACDADVPTFQERRDEEDALVASTYADLPYPANQLVALAHSLLARGVISEADLQTRMAAIRARMAVLTTQFSQNVLDATAAYELGDPTLNSEKVLTLEGTVHLSRGPLDSEVITTVAASSGQSDARTFSYQARPRYTAKAASGFRMPPAAVRSR